MSRSFQMTSSTNYLQT